MKYLSFLLVSILIFVSSCSDKVEPDITGDIVGIYKQVEDLREYNVTTTWLISKLSSSKIKVVLTTEFQAYQGYSGGYQSYTVIIDDVSMIDRSTISIDQDVKMNGDKYRLKGTGILSGKKLTVSLVALDLETNEEESSIYNLTKQ